MESKSVNQAEFVRDERPDLHPLVLFDVMTGEREFAPTPSSAIARSLIVSETHGDVRGITQGWCVSWKYWVTSSGLTARTVQYAYLAALHSLMGFAVAIGHIETNPFVGLGIKVKARKQNRVERGFTDAGARIVLSATIGEFGNLLPADQQRARRWLPWICNCSGAHIGGAAQLRKQDIVLEEGVWIIPIKPEAGSVKSGTARRVPIHLDLIEQGFIEMVRAASPGYLFADPSRRLSRAGGTVMHKKTSENLG